MIYLAIFVTVLASVISTLWFIRLVRVWNGAIKADDAMAWVFVLATSLGIAVSVILLRWTLSLSTGV